MSYSSGSRAQRNDGLSRRRFIGVAGAVGSAAALGMTSVNPAAAVTPAQRVRNAGRAATVHGQWGATVFPGSHPITEQSFASALSSFEMTTGTHVTTFKIYKLPTYMSVYDIQKNPYLAYCINNSNVRAVCCFLTKTKPNPTEREKLVKTYKHMVAAKLTNVCIVFNQEWQHNGFTGLQIKAVYQEYYEDVAKHIPGATVMYDNAGLGAYRSWVKGDPYPYCDIYGVDSYLSQTTYGKPLGNPIPPGTTDPAALVSLAHSHSKPWSIAELGITTGTEPVPKPHPNAEKTWIDYVAGLVSKDLDAGLPVDSVMWYYQPLKNKHNYPGPYVSQIQALAKALTNL